MAVTLTSGQLYGYPHPYTDPAKKDKDYIMQYGKAILSDFMANPQNSNWYHGRDRYAENLLYAKGKQSMDQYHAYFNPKKSGNRKPWERLKLKNLKIAPRYFRIVQDKLDQVQFDAICTPIDSLAREQKEEFAARLRALMENMKFLESIGMDASGMAPEGVPDVPIDEDELEAKLDTFQNQEAMDMEIKLAIALDQNDWEQIDKELDDDCKYMGACVFRDYTMGGKHKIKRIDPRMGIIPNSIYEDHRDLQHAGYLEAISLGELRAEAGSEFTEAEYEHIAGHAGSRNHYEVEQVLGNPIDSQKVLVYRFEFLSQNIMRARKSRGGVVRLIDHKYNPKSQPIEKPYKTLYKGTIILNTDLGYGCGPDNNQKRGMSNRSECELTIHAFVPNMLDGESLCMAQEIQAPIDAIYRDWISMHDTIAKAVPQGYKYDFRLMENIVMKGGAEGKALSKAEIVEIHQATGNAYIYSVDSAGNTVGSQGITKLEGGLPDDVIKYGNMIRENIHLLEMITGINDVTAGNNPNPEMGKATSELAVEASLSSITHLFRCKRKRFEHLCRSMAIRIRAGEKYKPLTGALVKPNGREIYTKENPNLEKHQYAIKIENRPSKEEWDQFYMQCQKSIDTKEITTADMAAIRICDNLKQAWYILASRQKRNEKKKLQMDMQNQQATFEGQAKAAQVAEEEKRKTLEFEYQLKTQFETTKSDLARTAQTERYDREEVLEGMRVKGREDVATILGDQELTHTAFQEGINSGKPDPKPAQTTTKKPD